MCEQSTILDTAFVSAVSSAYIVLHIKSCNYFFIMACHNSDSHGQPPIPEPVAYVKFVLDVWVTMHMYYAIIYNNYCCIYMHGIMQEWIRGRERREYLTPLLYLPLKALFEVQSTPAYVQYYNLIRHCH